MRKPEIKPTIARFNRSLSKLVACGVVRYAEAVRERGAWAKLHKARPKRCTR